MSDEGKVGEPWTECGAPDCSCRLVWCRHDDVVLGRFYTAADNEGEGYTPERALANMRRAIACVNALAGLDPEALAAFIVVARELHSKALGYYPLSKPARAFDAALAKLEGKADAQ